MTDHPTPFSAPMIRALLEGRKTQTRRVLKPQPPEGHDLVGIYAPGLTAVFNPAGKRHRGHPDEDFAVNLPSLKDRLWVREAWKTDRCYDDLAPSEMGGEEPLLYMADNAVERWGGEPDALSRWGRHRAGMHMPRWASRLTLTVSGMRIARVQDISEEDAREEGPGFVGKVSGHVYENVAMHRLGGPYWRNARDWFADLWDSLNAKRGFGWDANPWVVATTFTVHHVNIDQMEAA